jgi:hypothetical protein
MLDSSLFGGVGMSTFTNASENRHFRANYYYLIV